MAVEFSVAHTRKTEYLIDPALIVVKPQLNGRVELPDITWLVESMVALGQRVPVEIRNEGGKPVLVSGHSRWRAAVEINKKKLTEGKFLLRCVYSRCNEQEGFIANLHENLVRSAPTPLDDAYNIRRLESWGRSLEEIAEIYRKRNAKGEPDVRWVKGRLALISLGQEGRAALKEGRLKVTAAQAIAKLSEEQQRERLAEGKAAKPPLAPKKKQPSMAEARLMALRGRLRTIAQTAVIPESVPLPVGASAPAVIKAICKLCEWLLEEESGTDPKPHAEAAA